MPAPRNTSQHYPFGMVMPSRNWDAVGSDGYRFGFNSFEMDNEFFGEGNCYYTEFREYDSRIGRWFSIDPLFNYFPWQSPYVAFDNNPIFYKDPKGAASEPHDNYNKLERRREKNRKYMDSNQRKVERKMKRTGLTDVEVRNQYRHKHWIDHPTKYDESTGARLYYPDIKKDGAIKFTIPYDGQTMVRQDVLYKGELRLDYDAQGYPDRIIVTSEPDGNLLYDSKEYVFQKNTTGPINTSNEQTTIIRIQVIPDPSPPESKFGDGRYDLKGSSGKIKISISPNQGVLELKPYKRSSKWLGKDI